MRHKPLMTRQRRENILINIALIAVVLLAMLPIATTVLVSFKMEQDVTRKPPVIFPCDTETQAFEWAACRWSVEGYDRVLKPEPASNWLGFELTGNMIRTYIPNTLLYATTTSLLVVILAGLSGYAFSRYRFRGHRPLMVSILAITGVPLLTNLLALYQMGVKLRKADIPFYDDRFFIIMVYMGFFLPLSVWIAKGFFDAIPRELEDAALIDGCSPLGALWRVIMPLAAPGLMAVFLLTFVGVWNEFIAGYLLISKNDHKTVMFGLYDFLGQNIINLQVLAAACILIALPVVVLFLFTRRTFFKAMVEGAIKG
ncbi:MAG: carbohydrate ABC transporter permease [Ardenticatenaceae bacterium]|nr:carbohydrate ABC transporter permease [Anaerolineales bacterium]MCB8921619.1 carbohydrate ABC transporter permease [Ardenticatenaceae bacterium]MCB9003348.1 carbohydrate ABC transporter permease [Ardenticatenaceae bacterium]